MSLLCKVGIHKYVATGFRKTGGVLLGWCAQPYHEWGQFYRCKRCRKEKVIGGSYIPFYGPIRDTFKFKEQK